MRKLKKTAKKRGSSARMGYAHKGRHMRGITKHLDRAFTSENTARSRRGGAFRKRAIAAGIRVDNQLTRYAKNPKGARLGPAAKVRALTLPAHAHL